MTLPAKPDVDVARSTRDFILAVALRQFSERGFHATSITEIADEVGIRRPSLLHHFPSKEALYREVLLGSFADWGALVEEAVTEPVEGWAQVERVIRAAFDFFEHHPEFVRLVRHEALDGGPLLKELLRLHLRPMFNRAVGYLEAEMDEGHLRRFDARHLLLAGYGAALSYFSDAPFIEALIDDDPVGRRPLDAHCELVLAIFRNALEP